MMRHARAVYVELGISHDQPDYPRLPCQIDDETAITVVDVVSEGHRKRLTP